MPPMSAQTTRKTPAERAFVVQFEPVEGSRGRVRGRVQLVASGEAFRFRSVKQLVVFMLETLRKPADEPSDFEESIPVEESQ